MDQNTLSMLVRLAESGQADTLLGLLGSDMGGVAVRRKALTNTLLYGNGGLFTVCADDNLINASVNDDGICAVIPWKPTVNDVRRQPVITAIGHLDGGAQPTDQCGDPPVSDWRGCELEWCTGRIRGRSPEYDRLDLGTRWCEKYPIFRTFGSLTVGGDIIAPTGTQIQNDAEWGAVAAAIQTRQILGRWIYTGHRATNRNMFDGFQILVNTGYTDVQSRIACPAVDSKIENYEGDCVNDETSTKNVYSYLEAVVQRIMQRARQAGLGRPKAEDMVLVMRSEMAEALYEYWACQIGPCSTTVPAQGTLTNQVQFVSADWARQFADDLRRREVLLVHGMHIPVVTDDYMPFTNGPGVNERLSDIYVLTLQISGLPNIYGEYQDFRAGVGDRVTGFQEELYGGQPTDEGRFYVWQERTNTCFDVRLAIKPRLVIAMPFLCGRVTNICARPLNPPLSSYPPDGSPYYPDGGAHDATYDAGDCVYSE